MALASAPQASAFLGSWSYAAAVFAPSAPPSDSGWSSSCSATAGSLEAFTAW